METKTTEKAAVQLKRLLEMMTRLRAPDGCPWDREQTMESLRPYLVEECYEVLDAIDSGSKSEHREELGDLLFQIVFQAELARESGDWDLADVIQAIADKLEYRHPHVFGDVRVGSVAEVEQNWAKLKAAEKEKKKGRRVSVLDGVPRHAPGLVRAERLTEKASRIGFDWPNLAGVRSKVDEELGELDEALAGGDRAAIEHELGDVLFSLANLARHARVPAEEALRMAIRRFETRFTWMEERLHERTGGAEASAEEMDALWEEAKRREASGS
ncbi:nucleoside triphosphate pyrophosphohydrolase [Vulgatibacter incomptus]|uniref:Nucleoside triphosphate pyrophosphohydrolase MazG n=1 Tax=Vulgatibacter incomptus TaxID=1391653 RepID=A0A0K1PAM8_9BACT|nr:nucleoside triphosphate pyrophosphohydrolase [Vulgatibacter incomptus]AKU90593.1 Nucleoside triphosphate pyrophosphohydrolase MazG [Vulgatibacter incomptus]